MGSRIKIWQLIMAGLALGIPGCMLDLDSLHGGPNLDVGSGVKPDKGIEFGPGVDIGAPDRGIDRGKDIKTPDQKILTPDIPQPDQKILTPDIPKPDQKMPDMHPDQMMKDLPPDQMMPDQNVPQPDMPQPDQKVLLPDMPQPDQKVMLPDMPQPDQMVSPDMLCAKTPMPGWCLIEGACHKDGVQDTAIPWRRCVVATSQTAWTMVGKVDTMAGSGVQGAKNGPAMQAEFKNPISVVYCPLGTIYVGDQGNHMIRVITGGTVGTLAGTGTMGHQDGAQATARFNLPSGLAVNNACGKVYVADRFNQRIRLISGGQVSTFAGKANTGSVDGPITTALFHSAMDVVLGSGGTLYVADTNNHKIRVISSGKVSTLAGDGTPGLVNGPAAKARFNLPQALAVDSAGKVYVADTHNSVVRVISGGQVSTLAGTSTKGLKDGAVATAMFNLPQGIAVDGKGLVYVGDRSNHRIRLIASGHVYTLAGGAQGFGDGGLGTAKFSYPAGVDVYDKNVFVADRGNHRIRMISR